MTHNVFVSEFKVACIAPENRHNLYYCKIYVMINSEIIYIYKSKSNFFNRM